MQLDGVTVQCILIADEVNKIDDTFSGAKWNVAIDIFVDSFVVTDDDDNTYIGLYGIYGLVNDLKQRIFR